MAGRDHQSERQQGREDTTVDHGTRITHRAAGKVQTKPARAVRVKPRPLDPISRLSSSPHPIGDTELALDVRVGFGNPDQVVTFWSVPACPGAFVVLSPP